MHTGSNLCLKGTTQGMEREITLRRHLLPLCSITCVATSRTNSRSEDTCCHGTKFAGMHFLRSMLNLANPNSCLKPLLRYFQGWTQQMLFSGKRIGEFIGAIWIRIWLWSKFKRRRKTWESTNSVIGDAVAIQSINSFIGATVGSRLSSPLLPRRKWRDFL